MLFWGLDTSKHIVTRMALPAPRFAADGSAQLVQSFVRRRLKFGRAAGQKPHSELRLTQFSQILITD